MGFMDILQAAVNVESVKLAAGLADILPRMVLAIILILLGWVVALLLKRLVLKILKGLKFEDYLKSQKLDKALGAIVVSEVLALIVYYYTLVLFFQSAFDLVYLTGLAVFIGEVLAYVPVIIGAVLILLLATILGEYVKLIVLQLDEKSGTVQVGARLSKLLVMYVGAVMALSMLGFDTQILDALFITVAQAVFFGIALACAIAFGLGGQEAAKDWIKTARTKVLKA
jgi:hypothetical protein